MSTKATILSILRRDGLDAAPSLGLFANSDGFFMPKRGQSLRYVRMCRKSGRSEAAWRGEDGVSLMKRIWVYPPAWLFEAVDEASGDGLQDRSGNLAALCVKGAWKRGELVACPQAAVYKGTQDKRFQFLLAPPEMNVVGQFMNEAHICGLPVAIRTCIMAGLDVNGWMEGYIDAPPEWDDGMGIEGSKDELLSEDRLLYNRLLTGFSLVAERQAYCQFYGELIDVYLRDGGRGLRARVTECVGWEWFGDAEVAADRALWNLILILEQHLEILRDCEALACKDDALGVAGQRRRREELRTAKREGREIITC